jgi:hypothetical protein
VDDRLETLLDRQEIGDLVLRYAIALDSHDWDLLRTCFTPDARVRLLWSEQYLDLERFVEVARGALEALDASQHFLAAPYVELAGDRATSRTYCRAQHTRRSVGDQPNYMIGLTYVDELRKTDQGWRIAQRELHESWAEGNPDVLGLRPSGGERA